MGMIQTKVFAQSLSNFTCKLWMMKGETLLILGCRVKGQGQLWPPARGCHALRCLVFFSFGIGFCHGTDWIRSLPFYPYYACKGDIVMLLWFLSSLSCQVKGQGHNGKDWNNSVGCTVYHDQSWYWYWWCIIIFKIKGQGQQRPNHWV